MAKQPKGGGITWTNRTWNCIRGCSRVSSGCGDSTGGGCYAERQAYRFSGKGQPYEGLVRMTPKGPRWTGDVRFVEEHLIDPLRWSEPSMIFVNSMSDLFHERVTDQQVIDIFGIMVLAHWHKFQVLTKRPERMRDFMLGGDHGIIEQFSRIMSGGGIGPKQMFRALDRKRREKVALQWPPPNVWLGVSAEDQRTADERIPFLLDTPAAIRWLSAEPLLGPISLIYDDPYPWVRNYLHGTRAMPDCDDPAWDKRGGLDWVVVGGESGPGARPMNIEWIRSIMAECKATSTPIFVKQLGSNAIGKITSASLEPVALNKNGWICHSKGGEIAEFPKDLQVREFPK